MSVKSEFYSFLNRAVTIDMITAVTVVVFIDIDLISARQHLLSYAITQFVLQHVK